MQVVKIPVNDYCVPDNVLRGKACGDESKICRAVIGKKRRHIALVAGVKTAVGVVMPLDICKANESN